jgi:hypothetical protein
MINIDGSKMLDSSFFENLVWGALHKAWKGYVIAKNKGEDDKMVHYGYYLGMPINKKKDSLMIMRIYYRSTSRYNNFVIIFQ